MQQRFAHFAALQAAGQGGQVFDAGLGALERPVEQIEQGLAAEIGNAGRIGPDDPRPIAVPQPRWLGQNPQILQRWQNRVIHSSCRKRGPCFKPDRAESQVSAICL